VPYEKLLAIVDFAVAFSKRFKYQSTGTVEFLYRTKRDETALFFDMKPWL
jgi:pyruvate carboxylase